MNLTDYYMTAPLYEPPHIEQREFGVCLKKLIHPQRNPIGMWRHLSFSSVEKLRSFLMRQKPIHVYFSSARYTDPTHKIMAEKGWLGGDLIFDIDNDHLKTPTIAEAAYNANKLYWFLENKFGLKDMIITFSGSRGYHIHARDECVQSLGGYERQDIMDYFREYKQTKPWKIYNKNYVGLDTTVTGDLSRLIRLPGSIHGKTKQPCRIIRAVE